VTTGVVRFDGALTSADERRRFLEVLALPPNARLLEAEGSAVAWPDDSFDGVLCIDAIASVPDRAAALAEWTRVVKPGGRILYTDPAIVAGLVSSDELAMRGAMGFCVFSAQGDNEMLIESAGLRLLRADDATDGIAMTASCLRDERAERERELVVVEGRERYDTVQRFLAATHRLASERRLARIAFLAEKSR